MVTQRGATSGERAQRVHGGGPKATHSVLVPQCCEPGAVRLLEVLTWLAEAVKLNLNGLTRQSSLRIQKFSTSTTTS